MSGKAALFEGFEILFAISDKNTATTRIAALSSVWTVKAYSLVEKEYSAALR